MMSEIEINPSLEREKQMSVLVANKLKTMNQAQWRFHVGNKTVEVQQQVNQIC